MSPPLDDGVENLQAFCELLKTTNPVLESGAADLGRLAHSLSDSESRLSQDLDHLAMDMDGLQKEAETSEAAAVKACGELGHAAEEANTGPLANLEKEAAAAQSHWTHGLQEKSSALDSAFQELKSAGWEPLDAVLASEKGDFEKWTHAADEAIGGLVHLFTSVATDVEHDLHEATTAGHDLTGTPPFEHAFWQDPESHAQQVTDTHIPLFRNEIFAEAMKDLATVQEDLVAVAEDFSGQLRDNLDTLAKQAAEGIDTKASEVTQAIQQTEEALVHARDEFEHSSVQADRAETEAHGLADLAKDVFQAEVELQQIHAAMEAMGQ